MNAVFKSSIFAIAVLSLTACVHAPKDAGSIYARAPDNVYINVNFDEKGCPQDTQTAAKSCPFLGDRDPVGLACQEPSSSNARRKIIWEGSREFTIHFEEGTPFKNTTGRCDLSSAEEGFTCLLRKDTESPPLVADYKYDVVVNAGEENECRLDPRIYLMR